MFKVFLQDCATICFMRRLLVHLLMFVMLTPGLVCGPFMGTGKAHAATGQMKSMPGCHGMAMNDDTGGKSLSGHDGTMLFKDCAKIDLYGADHAVLKKPDTGKVLFVSLAGVAPVYVFTPADFHAQRGPPPDWHDLSQTRPSILLITQRFRE